MTTYHLYSKSLMLAMPRVFDTYELAEAHRLTLPCADYFGVTERLLPQIILNGDELAEFEDTLEREDSLASDERKAQEWSDR